MLKAQNDRLRHFLVNAPTNFEELTECMLLALERVAEIAAEYTNGLEDMPIQLKGELRLLDDLVAANVQHADRLLNAQLSHLCESMLASTLEVELPWHRPPAGTMARSAGQTLH